MELVIREPNVDDVEGIVRLSGQLGYASGAEKTAKRLSEILSNTDHCAFVAVDNGMVTGWIHGLYALRMESDAFVEIGGLVIDEKYRRKGIGKVLVQKVLEWSRIKNVSALRVRCNTIRKESHQFYRNIGFAESKEQKVFSIQVT